MSRFPCWDFVNFRTAFEKRGERTIPTAKLPPTYLPSPPLDNLLVQRGEADIHAAGCRVPGAACRRREGRLSAFCASHLPQHPASPFSPSPVGKLLNETTGRLIDIGKSTYQKLLTQGYEVDMGAGTISPPSAGASASARSRAEASPRRRSGGDSGAGGGTRRRRLSTGG
jgi:hypothetical protein